MTVTDETAVDPTEASTEEESKEPEFIPSDANLRLETKKFVLQSVLDKAAAVLPSRDTMPVLKNFQLDVSLGRVRVIATDLQLHVIAETQMANVITPGVAVFPGKRLLELVKEAEDGDLVLDVVEGKASIQVGRAQWNLMLQDGSDYPPIPDTDDVELHTIDRGKFLGALGAVRYAAATDTVRPSLMMIDISGGKMRAADGVRYQSAELGDHFPLDIQIPIGAVDDLVKLLRTTDQNTLDIGESENYLVFRIADDVFIAQKPTAAFPDVDELILKAALANDERLQVDRQELINALKRVRVTADPETSAIILALDSNILTVKSRDKFGNWAQETLDVSWENNPREVAVNHAYLMDMLQMSDVKSCLFLLGQDAKTRKSPLMLQDEEAGTIGVLNQMRTEFLN